MPFPEQNARPFTREQVQAINPGQMGCYGLFVSNSHWVYVGKGDIRARLMAHLNGDNPCITRQAPTHWVDVVTPGMDQLEKALIIELQPACNQKVG